MTSLRCVSRESIPQFAAQYPSHPHPEHLQLPVYVPNEEEKADPKLYAQNVRKAMVGGEPSKVACGWAGRL